MKLSVVIPNYIINPELGLFLRTALFSILRADIPEHEVILVDDGSPFSGGYMRDEADVYIKHKTNLGFIRSVNDGLKVARGEYILVSNNDIKVAPNFFTVAEEIFDNNEDVLSVHPRMIGYDEPIELGNKTYTEGRERWCQSSFFILKNRGQLFPENFQGTGGAYEDWYFWSEIRGLGFNTAYTTKTCFQHKHSATTMLLGEETKAHKENMELFKRRFGAYPEDYYNELYPEQMAMDWAKVFKEL